ncbi:MAG: hypothetical protein AAF367_08005 [Pseudomonadota bacterium]
MSTCIVKEAFKNSVAIAGAMTSAALMIGAAPVANAQGAMCGKRDDVIAQLQTVHGESRTSVGLQRNAQVMETYANRETGSWTIIVSLPSGMACLVAAGEAFQVDEASAKSTTMDDPA